jgi:hypothetical protein
LRIFDEIDHPAGDRVRAKLGPHDDQLPATRFSQPPDRRAASLA